MNENNVKAIWSTQNQIEFLIGCWNEFWSNLED